MTAVDRVPVSSTQPLRGRLAERRLVESLIDVVQDGFSRALVIVGEAGMGKTRLLEHALGAANGTQVARSAGSESEAHLAFAGLHRLLWPFMHRIDTLPAPQRTALATAFGLVSGPPPDLFLVGLAALTLLAEVAGTQPLLCLVDDAHWLDRESLAAIAFIGRRLDADAVGLLISVRDEPTALAALHGLETHRLTGLADQDAHGLIASQAEGRLDPHVVSRIVAETGGNPLALIEVTGELSREQLAGGSVVPELLPIGRTLEAHFIRRVILLPPETRLLLLLVAVAPADDQAVLWRAAARLSLAPAALDVAVSAEILLPERPHTIRHPLIRSAIYGAASPTDRRAVHAALGEAIDRAHDPDGRAWHLAESVVGLDDVVAEELASAADRARDRGGYATQAAFLSRAAELTSDGRLRALRFLAATQPYLLIGDIASVARRLDQATPGLTQPALRAAAQRVRAATEWYTEGSPVRAPAILLDALATFGPLDESTTRAMLWEALTAGVLAGRYTAEVTLFDIASTALKTPRPHPRDATLADVLLDAFATRIADDYDRAVPVLRAAVAALRTMDLADNVGPLTVVGSWTALDLWDDEGFEAVVTRLGEFSRSRGALYAVNSTLYTMAAWKTFAGRFAEAQAHYTEAAEIIAATGLTPEGAEHRVVLLAWQGREDETRAAVELTQRVWAQQLGYAVLENHALYAMVILELGLGRYPEALACAQRLLADDLPGEGNRVLADVVEAATRAGDRRTADSAFARLADRASASGTHWALGLLARGRALLADDDQAEAHYQESHDRLSRTSVRTELARTHLLYGEWLRRRGRRADARGHLRTAHDLFATMGAAAFAERARTELQATGESVRRRSSPPEARLTPQEFKVASLVIGGATNAEIATRLFVTASTVEYHLNKIFRKLDITSRRQLAQVMTSDKVLDLAPAGEHPSPQS